MKLAFLLFKYFPYGGLQRNMLAIAQAAVARGHRVRVLCTAWEAPPPPGIEVQVLPRRGWTNATRMANFAADAARALAGDRDLVVGFNKLPGLDVYYAADTCFAWKARHRNNPWARLTPRSRTYLDFERRVFGADAATAILEVSILERPRFHECHRTPAARFHTLPPGIAHNRAEPANFAALRAALRRELNAADGQHLLLALGSGFQRKGVDRCIAALAELVRSHQRDARLLVAGTGDPGRYLRQARRLGVADRVHFLGGRGDVPELLQGADVLLHPAYEENTGNVLIEAMIAGLPVIATDVCGYAHYVARADMGRVIPSPFQPEALVQAIAAVLAVPRATWRERGRALAGDPSLYARPQVAVDIIEAVGAKLSAQVGAQAADASRHGAPVGR